MVDEPADNKVTKTAPEYGVHGTYLEVLEGESGVLKRGLSRCGRKHVHLAKGIIGQEAASAGMLGLGLG